MHINAFRVELYDALLQQFVVSKLCIVVYEVLHHHCSQVLQFAVLDVLAERLQKHSLAQVVLTTECVIDVAKEKISTVYG